MLFSGKKTVNREEIEVLKLSTMLLRGIADGRSHQIRKRDLCSSESAGKCEKKQMESEPVFCHKMKASS